jgi:hypothetical protein
MKAVEHKSGIIVVTLREGDAYSRVSEDRKLGSIDDKSLRSNIGQQRSYCSLLGRVSTAGLSYMVAGIPDWLDTVTAFPQNAGWNPSGQFLFTLWLPRVGWLWGERVRVSRLLRHYRKCAMNSL